MDKNSLLYQLMAMRMNGIMNGVAEQDEEDILGKREDFLGLTGISL